jgi:serine/threonine-protein kinase
VREQTIAGRYELKHVLGTGGMSSVYCAFDTLLERNVALKILHDQYGGDEEYVERFRREARSVAQLSHPNIVTVIDRGEEEGKQFIVFEIVEGENLKELVERGGPLPVRRALELGLEVGRALAFAHGQGLVHRDVKPQNVLLDGDGRAKVTDFGIARTLDAVGQTETGTVLGTSHYIAPEQARGERIDAQTDVYSFGVVLYELLTGEVPYPGDNFLTVAMKHVNEPVPSPLDHRPDTPLRLASLIESCMAKLPADRPASMDVVVVELEACLAELDAKDGGEGTMIMKRPKPAKARPARPKPARAPKQRRQRSSGFGFPVLPALVGLLLLAAVAGGIYLATRGGNPGSAAGSGAVTLSGVGAYDPDGGDGEHDDLAALATDGDPGTFWRTSTYRSQLSAFKSGVGLVLEASRKPAQIALTTDTPGFTAEIRAGDSPQGPFETVSPGKLVGPTTTWEVGGPDRRYYVIWITQLVGSAHVNEVKAS